MEKGGKLGGGSMVGNMGGGLIPAGMFKGGNFIEEKSMLGAAVDALLLDPEATLPAAVSKGLGGLFMRYGCGCEQK